MLYLRLLLSLFCLAFNSIHSMDQHLSKEEKILKPKTETYKELTRSNIDNQFVQKKDHKKNLFHIFTRSDDEPTESSPIKIHNNSLNTGPDTVRQLSPTKLTTSDEHPKVSPRTLNIHDTPKNQKKNSPRLTLEVNEDLSKLNHKNIIHKTTSNLPRSSSHNPYLSESSDHSSSNSQKKDTNAKRPKAKSTNDRMALLQRRKPLKDLMVAQNNNSEYNNLPIRLSQSAPITNDLTTPYQSTSSASLVDSENKINNSSTNILKKSSKSITAHEIDIISAIRSENVIIIQQYINNPYYDLNKANQYGMTPLHCAALEAVKSKNAKIIELLLSAERLDSSLKNNLSQTASQLIQGGDNCGEIRKLLFARVSLDMVLDREMFMMLMNCYIKEEPIDKYINETVETIKNKIRQTESSQGGSELPEKAKLPDYATDEFITGMILSRIPKDTTDLECLVKTIHQETQVLLFNVTVENTMIVKLTSEILQRFEKKTVQEKSFLHKSYTKKPESSSLIKLIDSLPKFIDYDLICTVIMDSIKKEKRFITPSHLEMISQEESK